MPILYITDLDGTLLRSDATLSAFSRSVLADLLSRGVLFTVASARSVTSIRPILNGLPLPLPVIEFNGAFISDLDTGRHAIINDIDRDLAVRLDHEIARAGFVARFSGADRLAAEGQIGDHKGRDSGDPHAAFQGDAGAGR